MRHADRTPTIRKPMTANNPQALAECGVCHRQKKPVGRDAPPGRGRPRKEAVCCGGGGAMLCAEETEGTRINRDRTEELLATGAEKIAISCPFCQIMIRDATADLGKSNDVVVEDIAQFVAARLEV